MTTNDLPATRKAIGMAAANSHHYCSVCKAYGVVSMHDTDHHNWTRKDVATLRAQAYAWQDAKTQAARDAIFEKYGVCWSELWRLPYWDPTKMAVVDLMHCILEGLIHYHCRRVLRIDASVAKRKETMGAAFDYDWPEYDPAKCPAEYKLRNAEKEIGHIRRVQGKLMQPLLEDDGEDDGDGVDNDGDVAMPDVPDPQFVPALTVDQLRAGLMTCNLPALRFVAWSLEPDSANITHNLKKKQYCDRLIAWVSNPSSA